MVSALAGLKYSDGVALRGCSVALLAIDTHHDALHLNAS